MYMNLLKNWRRVKAYVVIFFCLLLSLPVFFYPKNGQAAADREAQVVRIGYFEDNDGFQTGFSDTAPKSGYAYEYYQELAKYTGWTYKYVYGSWSDIYTKLVQGEVDIMGGMSKIDARLPYMLYAAQPMGVESYYVFVPINNTSIRINDVTSLNNKRIGVNDHSYMLELFTKFVAERGLSCEIVPFSGSVQRMEALNRGELDGVVTVDNYTINDLKPVFKVGASDYYFAVNKNRPDILQALNAAQEKIIATSPYYITHLQKKYFGNSVIREALSDEERGWLQAHPTLRIGYLANNMPYCGLDKSTNRLTGLLAEIMPLLQKFTGSTFAARAYSTAQDLNAALNAGDVDMIFPAFGDMWSAENQAYILTGPVADDRLVVIYRAAQKANLYKRIAISRQSAIQDFYVKLKYPEAKQIIGQDTKACLTAVLEDKADSMLVSSNSIYRYFSEFGQPAELRMANLESTVNYCLAVKRGNTILYSITNKAVASLDRSQLNNVLIQNASVATKYSLKKFLQYNVGFVIVFLSGLFLFLALLFINYRNKTQQNQAKLTAAYQRADKAARAKSEFLSNMSHDMRTPMNAIINLTSLAREDLDDQEKLQDDLQKIEISNKFLMGLINDILDMSKIESGHIELHPSVYRFEDFEHYISSIIEPLCVSKNIHFNWQRRKTPVTLYVDEVRFNQIFFNLLSNAVKYSPPGSTISLKAENDFVQDNILQIDYIFTDNGIGMSEEFQKKLFQPFERENSADATMGTGLGLAITKRIITEMGGTIKVASVKGQGTTVTVHLAVPVATAQQLQAYGAKVVQKSSPAAYTFAGKHILVAEDHFLNREIVLRILQKNGLLVTLAEDGQKAVEAFALSATGYFAAILMDVRMPVLDGLEATRRIRALPRADAKTVPIIAMTAEAFTENKRETIAAGMNEHLTKPIDPKKMLQTLQQSIDKQNALT